jgi:hypothetical protein
MPELWAKRSVIVEHEAAASLSLPALLPHISRKRPRIEPMGDLAEDSLNDAAIRDQNSMSALSPCPFARKKARLRTSKTPRGVVKDINSSAETSVPAPRLSAMPPKDSREHSALEWELQKDNIERLYKLQKKKLMEVKEIMYSDYGFAATYVQLAPH